MQQRSSCADHTSDNSIAVEIPEGHPSAFKQEESEGMREIKTVLRTALFWTAKVDLTDFSETGLPTIRYVAAKTSYL